MVSTALLRAQLEVSLAERAPGAFTLKTRQAPELYPSGIAALDDLLGGGVPRGGITEIAGTSTTGRTTVALSLLAHLTSKGGAVAWVDVQDAFDPETAAAHGVCLERLLWLRVAGAAAATPISTMPTAERGGPQFPAQPSTQPSTSLRLGVGGTHPRNEMHAIDHVVSQLLRVGNDSPSGKRIAPGSINQPLLFDAIEPRCAESQPHRRKIEQVSTDRQPPRRGELVLEGQAKRIRQAAADLRPDRLSPGRLETVRPRPRLDQALRATDLLLQAGGFGAIVLDMSDVRAELATRIATSYWYRFRLAAEQAQSALILLTQTPCTKSCASLVLRCSSDTTEPWRHGTETALFTTLRYRVTIDRQRHQDIDPAFKKPSVRADSATWRTQAQWAR